MNRLRDLILYALAAILALSAVSCEHNGVLYYNNMTMGNIVDGRFVSDQGNIFNIVEQTCDGVLDTMKRAIVVCDVLNLTKGTENEYDVTLHQFARVLTKDPTSAADATGDIEVKDPIHVSEVWFSGGYLNMYVQVPIHRGSKTKHLINLVYKTIEDGVIEMEVRHNAFGDVHTDDADVISLAGSYVSFPIIDTIGKEDAKIIIKWKWYELHSTGYGWSDIEKEYKVEYDWKKEGFIQSNPH